MKLMNLARLGLVLVVVFQPKSSFAWSDTVYRLVLRKAIDTLPKAQKKYFEDHKYEMPSLVPDEDPPVRPEGRRFALDLLGTFPFNDVPQDEAGVKAKADPLVVGRLPFLLLEAQARLVDAFKVLCGGICGKSEEQERSLCPGWRPGWNSRVPGDSVFSNSQLISLVATVSRNHDVACSPNNGLVGFSPARASCLMYANGV